MDDNDAVLSDLCQSLCEALGLEPYEVPPREMMRRLIAERDAARAKGVEAREAGVREGYERAAAAIERAAKCANAFAASDLVHVRDMLRSAALTPATPANAGEAEVPAAEALAKCYDCACEAGWRENEYGIRYRCKCACHAAASLDEGGGE